MDSFKDTIDNDKQGGDFYKMVKGEQKFRIMSSPVKKVERYGHGICYPGASYCDPAIMQKEYLAKVSEAKKEGKDASKVNAPSLTTKYMCWALLRGKPDRFVILQLPKKVAEQIRQWMDNAEYGFDSFPMPYDITISADENVGTPRVKYAVLASRKETPLTEEETLAFEKQTPVQQILERLQNKKKTEVEGSGTVEYPQNDDEGESSIPF